MEAVKKKLDNTDKNLQKKIKEINASKDKSEYSKLLTKVSDLQSENEAIIAEVLILCFIDIEQ